MSGPVSSGLASRLAAVASAIVDLLGGLGFAKPTWTLGTNLSIVGSTLTATTGTGSTRQANLPLTIPAGTYRLGGYRNGSGSITPRFLGGAGGTINGVALGAGDSAWEQDIVTAGSTSLNFLIGNTTVGTYSGLYLRRIA